MAQTLHLKKAIDLEYNFTIVLSEYFPQSVLKIRPIIVGIHFFSFLASSIFPFINMYTYFFNTFL